MSLEIDAIRMADDPPRFFEHSNDNAHHLPAGQVAGMQLHALQQRFQSLRRRLPVLDSVASEQGVERIASLDEASRLLFPDRIYKSYPLSYLEKNRFAILTRWLSRLSTVDLGSVDVSHCDGIDSWLRTLEEATTLQVVNSSGTSGTMTFLPRTRQDQRILSDVFGMTSREFNQIPGKPDVHADPWHSFYLGFRGGYSHAARAAGWVIDNFAGSRDYFYPLYDFDMSSDVMFVASRLRRAAARGETLAIDERLQARRAEFDAIQQGSGRAMENIFKKLISLKGEKVYISGMTGQLTELASRGFAQGYEGLFGPTCVIQCGGGNKGGKLPDDWEERLLRFSGTRRIGQYYGMTELTSMSSKCSEGDYHIPPWIVPYVLHPDTGALQPRVEVQTGRAAFFDLVPQTYWGGIVSGDEVTMDWRPCACGRTSVHLRSQISRFSEKTGEEDKITCAAAEDAHAAAIDFLTGTSSESHA